MRPAALRAWFVPLAIWAGSCAQPAQMPQPTPEGEVSPAALKQQIQDLKNQLEDLKKESTALAAQAQELRLRELRLSNELWDIQFTNARLKEQVEVLARAPVERDKYKAKLDALTEEIEWLKKTGVIKDTTHPGTSSAPAEAAIPALINKLMTPPTAPAASAPAPAATSTRPAD